MLDEKAYESNGGRLAAPAQLCRQVAQQTAAPLQNPLTYTAADDGRQIEAVGAHWLLDAREHHIEDTAELAVEVDHSHYYVVLLRDGALKTVSVVVEEIRLGSRLGGRESVRYKRNHRVGGVGDEQIRLFDFDNSDYDNPPTTGFTTRRNWGNYFPGLDAVRFGCAGWPAPALRAARPYSILSQ
jgi:hypothetical protein